MVYQYCGKGNFEDFASGRVLLHRTGYPNFPVRLAQEIFCRCLARLDSAKPLRLYDPCCGGGYLLTVLGFLNYGRLETIAASDISGEAVQLARENLSLLGRAGLARRKEQLSQLRALHGKSSHQEALESAERLGGILGGQAHEIQCQVFQRDIFSPSPQDVPGLQADIIFTDVPYGNLVDWQSQEDSINFLDQLLPAVREGSVVAICSNKQQRFQSEHFRRVEKQAVGKRLFQIFMPI